MMSDEELNAKLKEAETPYLELLEEKRKRDEEKRKEKEKYYLWSSPDTWRYLTMEEVDSGCYRAMITPFEYTQEGFVKYFEEQLEYLKKRKIKKEESLGLIQEEIRFMEEQIKKAKEGL